MQKKYFLLIIIIIALAGGWYIFNSNPRIVGSQFIDDHKQNKATYDMDTYVDTKYKFTFQSPKDSLIVSDDRSGENPKGLSFLTKSTQLIGEINFPIKKYTNGSFSINLQKDVNSGQLPIADWWDEFGFHNEKQGPEPYKQENIKVGGVDALKLYFFPQKGFIGSKYYNTIFIYMARGTDVYQIMGYQLPDQYKDPDFIFTPEEIQSAKEYEKIFNQVLSSFKFTN